MKQSGVMVPEGMCQGVGFALAIDVIVLRLPECRVPANLSDRLNCFNNNQRADTDWRTWYTAIIMQSVREELDDILLVTNEVLHHVLQS